MRVRPVHISFLKEACNALSYRHCSFHIFNRPHLGRHLKYFMRLVAIVFAYDGAIKKEKVKRKKWERRYIGFGIRDFLVFPSYFYLLRLVASIIPRLRRLFFAGVCETCNSDRLLASPNIAQSPAVPAMSARARWPRPDAVPVARFRVPREASRP